MRYEEGRGWLVKTELICVVEEVEAVSEMVGGGAVERIKSS